MILKKVKQVPEPKFTKEQILESKKFRHNRDLATVLLAGDGQYSIDEVSSKLENYLKGEVK